MGSTERHHHANETKSSMEAERVQAIGVLRNMQCKMNLAAETRQEKHFFSNEEKEK
jgi:hypothetical protein